MTQLAGISSFKQLFSIFTIREIITNPYIVAGVSLSVLGLVLWLGALSTLKLSYLTPLTGVTYIVIALLSWLLLDEVISPIHWIGIVVIAVGVFLINR